MGKQFTEIREDQIKFITNQKIFFVGTAGAEGRVNISPKGMDSLRIISKNKVIWLNLTGSGNETAAHLLEKQRITLMFCAFEGKPLILRLYGKGKLVHRRDANWQVCSKLFPKYIGARQIIEVDVDLVQKSCGFGVPFFDYKEDRDLLTKWGNAKGEEGIQAYWVEKNRFSIDGKPTKILEETE